jgi:PAS domain S-box-containing protein
MPESFLNLTYNAALLMLLIFIFDAFAHRWRREKSLVLNLLTGLAAGVIGIVIIQTHWILENGAIFDTRSILLSLSGLYFGTIPTIVAMAVTAIFRFILGGVGTLTGILVIVSAGSIGLIWRNLRKKETLEYTFKELYLFGLVVHVVMILLFFTFPWPMAFTVIENVSLPVMIIYPAATALLGTFMTHRLLREKLRDKISDEETKFRIVADHTSAWDYWISPDKKFIYCSASCLQITGYAQSEFMNEPKLLESIVHPDDAGILMGHKHNAGNRESGQLDFRIFHRSGQIRWIGHTCLPVFNSNGKFLGTRGSNRDITFEKEAEQKLLESKQEIVNLLEVTEQSRKVLLSVVEDQKMTQDKLAELNLQLEKRVEERTAQLSEVNRELEAFTYSVSHDLRAPLRGIRGFVDILMEEHAGSLDAEGRKLCLAVSDNAVKMGRLIDDLLALSRLSAKEINKSRVDMAGMVKAIYFEVTDKTERERIKLLTGELDDCFSDPTMMRQLLTNLLSNAVKFTSKTPEPVIQVNCERRDRKLVYSVSDNGAGFDMKYKNKLFGVFQRLHSVNDFEGTGIGLAIVHRIVLRHGGEVWAEGAVGKGATFWFSLPVM